MRLDAIRAEMKRRLMEVVPTVYERPSNSPMFPCAILGYPTLITYHMDLGYLISRLDIGVTLWVPRANAEAGMVDLDDYLSTSGERSISRALEAKPYPEGVWYRIAVLTATDLRTEGDALGVDFAVEVDA